MSSYTGYNGWTNKATWLVNLWWGDCFADMVADGTEVDADYIEGFVQEMIDDHMDTDATSGLLMDFINMALAEVNWRELASFYMADAEEEVEEDA